MTASLAERVAAVPADERPGLLAQIAADVGIGLALLLQAWAFWRRPEQLAPPGRWFVWLVMTGRGWGKTRTGAEWVLDRVEAGTCKLGALAGRTVGDVRATMIHGESGLIACAAARGLVADYVAGKRTVYVSRDGTVLAELEVITAVEPDGARGRNYDTAWADELAAWPNKVGPSGETCWTNLMLALRAGGDPRAVVTTTPKNVAVLRDLVSRDYVVQTRGSLYDNRANLAEQFVDLIVGGYEGTRLAAQEIHGILLLTVEGALWDQDAINNDRWTVEHLAGLTLLRTVVGVDPAAGPGTHGIVVVRAYALPGGEVHLAVMADYSMRGHPAKVAAAIGQAVDDWHADEVIVERNQGDAWVIAALEAAGVGGAHGRVRVVPVRATMAKEDRARPIAILSDRHRLHIVGVAATAGDGRVLPHAALEGEMTGWDPNDDTAESPDHLDALVHGAERLRPLVQAGPPRRRRPTGRNIATPAR